MHSDSLIKTSTPFENDAESRLLNFLMYLVYFQTDRRCFYQDDFKIDFCFQVKILKNHVLSYLTGATLHKDRSLLKLTAIFIASLIKKTYLVSG